MKIASFWLLLAYLVGQGGAFILQLICKFLGKDELAGLMVLLIGFFSFAFQFSDLGNSIYVVKRLAEGKNGTSTFLLVRSIFGFCICMAFALYTYLFDLPAVEIIPYLIALPLLGAAFGCLFLGLLEYREKYHIVALVNGGAWLIFVLCLSGYLFLDKEVHRYYGGFVVVFLLTYLFFTNRRLKGEFRETRGEYLRALKRVAQFLLPQIGSQIWGRSILLMIASTYGLAVLGVFGIVKYGQTFVSMLAGFVARPLLREYIIRVSEEKRKVDLVELLLIYKPALVIALFGPLIYALSLIFSSNQLVDGWLALLVIVPFSIVSQASVQANQMILSIKWQLVLSYLGLVLNIFVFFLFYKWSLVFAVVLGEISQGLWNLVTHFLRHKWDFKKILIFFKFKSLHGEG